ncbi:MAG: DDE-type integrase/transposase/recombinase [Bryobacteraceae bacterium]
MEGVSIAEVARGVEVNPNVLHRWRRELREAPGNLVHHSDRGSQYASGDYTDLLKANGIGVSMSRKGNPWDNAACEIVHGDTEVRRGFS